jgi:geranylgeranyl reductase family protein
MTRTTADPRRADVIVVGAGPAGSTTAAYLAQAGVDVLVLEKTAFPREKVCGDGLTPRAVKQLLALGIDMDEPGWVRNRGLRVVGGRHRVELPWPELSSFPGYGLVRRRLDFDEVLARHAEKLGARLVERHAVTGPVLDDRTGRVVGVSAKPVDDSGRKAGDEAAYHAPIVVASDGVSARMALALGLQKRPDRPLGVAVRTYYTSPRHDDDWMESWLELWDGEPGRSKLLPGYGWIFGMGDGTANVGLGMLNTSTAFGKTDYKDLLRRWLLNTPAEWGFRDDNRVGSVNGAALPMGFNRKPHYTRGMLLVGDCGGMVNPMNGEGIAYAMEAGQMAAAAIVQAMGRPEPARERALASYPAALDAAYGGYFTVGRTFVDLIGHPQVIRLATRQALPRRTLMRFLLKLMANLTDPHDGDLSDRMVNLLSRLAPAA